ncbi:MAG: hypothetical protein AB8U66_03765 [Rickettsiales endosymbiont of Dermacentor nuttalli]
MANLLIALKQDKVKFSDRLISLIDITNFISDFNLEEKSEEKPVTGKDEKEECKGSDIAKCMHKINESREKILLLWPRMLIKILFK